MKIVIPFLLILIPGIWFYIKHYSKKATVHLESNIFLTQLYESIAQNDEYKANELFNKFFQKASKDSDYILFLKTIPLTEKNEVCMAYITARIEEASKIEEARS